MQADGTPADALPNSRNSFPVSTEGPNVLLNPYFLVSTAKQVNLTQDCYLTLESSALVSKPGICLLRIPQRLVGSVPKDCKYGQSSVVSGFGDAYFLVDN